MWSQITPLWLQVKQRGGPGDSIKIEHAKLCRSENSIVTHFSTGSDFWKLWIWSIIVESDTNSPFHHLVSNLSQEKGKLGNANCTSWPLPPSPLPSWLRAPSCLPRYHNSDLKRLHRIPCSLKNRKLCLNSFVEFGLSFRTRERAVTLEVKLAKDSSQVVRAYSLCLQSIVCLGPELYVAEHLLFSDSTSTRLWYRFLAPLNSIKHGNLSLMLLQTAPNVILPPLVLECFVS